MPTKKMQNRRSDCPVSLALDILGDRWTLLVVRDMLMKGRHRYGEFLAADEHIATNILADRLKRLEKAGVIRKAPDPTGGARPVYALTDKGLDLAPVVLELIRWCAKYEAGTAAPADFVEMIERDREGVIARLKANAVAGG